MNGCFLIDIYGKPGYDFDLTLLYVYGRSSGGGTTSGSSKLLRLHNRQQWKRSGTSPPATASDLRRPSPGGQRLDKRRPSRRHISVGCPEQLQRGRVIRAGNATFGQESGWRYFYLWWQSGGTWQYTSYSAYAG